MTERTSEQPLVCPNCGAAVPGGIAECPDCGVDIFLMTDLLYRQHLVEALLPSSPNPTSTEELVPRLGDTLVSQKIISKEQLQQALDIQKEEGRTGESRRLGQILIASGAISANELDRIIASMVSQLQQALQKANHTLEERVRARTNELTNALEKLSELNKIKANFVAHISHELRTPMTHVMGFVDLLLDGTFGALSAPQSDAVGSINRASQRLNDLIEDLIQYSDTSRGEISLNLQPVILRDCVQTAYSRMTTKAQKGNVQLLVQIPSSLPEVQADAKRLTWVISQLLDNGIKFTPSGGKVEFRAELVESKVMISVSDTGIGIPVSRMEDIFQPFHQLDAGLNRRYGGTGIGLSLCKLIVEAHGSAFSVRSSEGQGSLFQFYLPMARMPVSPASGATGKPMTAREALL
jgi:signal transduction histidine kinase